MFVNLYVQEPDFGEHNFADFLDQIERVEAIYIRKRIESSYSDEHDPIEPYFFAMMRLTLSSGTAAAYIRTHPDLPITERDCRLSKLFQFLYVPLEIHFGLPESPEWETRVSLEELLDSLPDHHISHLQEFDWWSFYEDTRSHDLDTVISRLRERLPSFSDDNTPVGEKAIRDDGIGRASRRESVGALSAGGDQRQAVDSAQLPPAKKPQGPTESRKAKKPVRRSAKYEEIDTALREIAEARPKSHEDVFRWLDERKVAVPNRKPFKSAAGWKGFQQDRHAASVWLSLAWGRLGLPAFPRGPKK